MRTWEVKNLFGPLVPLDSKEGNSGRKMMYYLKDGVYGSLSCILNDAAELKPYLHRVNFFYYSKSKPKCAKISQIKGLRSHST